MKKFIKYLFPIYCSLFALCSFSQTNLVPNPSFEDTVTCPNNRGQITYATSWLNPTIASPDYMNACNAGQVGVPTLNQFQGFVQAWDNSASFLGGSLNVLTMGFDKANGIIEMTGSSSNSAYPRTPGLLVDYYCGKDVFICTGDNGGNVQMCTKNGGNVSIGSPYFGHGYMLSVNGKIIAEEVNVKLNDPQGAGLNSGWPDYVFDKKYKLRSIEELKKYTRKEKHLPDMPTAEEVEKGGVNVSEMITRLVKTQEEQAQYIILLNEQNKELQKEIELLKKRK